MSNVLENAAETYTKHIRLIMISAIPAVIAFLIPAFASFPTYNALGAVFIRTASIFANLNVLNTAVIVASVFFSLLFLSFAIVAINVVVKHSRTYTRIRQEVVMGLEKYTSRVFVVLLAFAAIVVLTDIVASGTGYGGLATSVVGLAATPFFFYAPASIVINDNKTGRAVTAGLRFFFKRFDYVLMWLVIAITATSAFDELFIGAFGPPVAGYALLIFDSLFILPFLIVLQSECYIKSVPMLRR